MGSDDSYGNNGVFLIKYNEKTILNCVVSDGEGWDHVSVHITTIKKNRVIQRTPTWKEMCKAKEIFFTDDEWVVQYHPAKKAYINDHDYTLHLWRPQKSDLPKPELWMV